MKRKKDCLLLLKMRNQKFSGGFGKNTKQRKSVFKTNQKQLIVFCQCQNGNSVPQKLLPGIFEKIKFYASLVCTGVAFFYFVPFTARIINGSGNQPRWNLTQTQSVVIAQVPETHSLSMKVDHSTYSSTRASVEDGPSHSLDANNTSSTLNSKNSENVEKGVSGIKQDNGSKKEYTFLVSLGSSLSLRDTVLTNSIELSEIKLRLRDLLQGFNEIDIYKIDAFIDFIKNIGVDFLKDMNNTIIRSYPPGDKFSYTSVQIMQGDRNLTLSGLSRVTKEGRHIALSKAELREVCSSFAFENKSSKEKPNLYAARVQRFLNYYQKGQAVLHKQQQVHEQEHGSRTIVDDLVDLQREAREILSSLEEGNFTQRTVFTSAKLMPSPQFSVLDLQIYGKAITPLQINPSFALNMIAKDSQSFCIGAGKAKFIHFGNSRFGMIAGADFSAQVQYSPDWKFNGFGVRAFVGLGWCI